MDHFGISGSSIVKLPPIVSPGMRSSHEQQSEEALSSHRDNAGTAINRKDSRSSRCVIISLNNMKMTSMLKIARLLVQRHQQSVTLA